MTYVILALAALAPQMGKKGALYLVEEISLSVEGVEIDNFRQKLWVGRDVIRQDVIFEDQRLSLLYHPNLQSIFVLDHNQRAYYISLTARDKKLFRSPLLSLATQQDGLLTRAEAIVEPTGEKRKIENYLCYKYKLRYVANFGLETEIWSTPYIERFDRNNIKRLWYAALGTNTIPPDVRQLLSQILDELNGIPIRTVTKIRENDMIVTTTSTIVHIELLPEVAPGFFDLPSDYKYAQVEQ